MLVYAYREDATDYARYRAWLESVIASDSSYGLADAALSGFLRVVTHPRIFRTPTPIGEALAFVTVVRNRPNCIRVSPGPRHWDVFLRLCRETNAKGNLVADAYLAALAIESGSEWVTTDRDFSRFAGLRWRHPLAAT